MRHGEEFDADKITAAIDYSLTEILQEILPKTPSDWRWEYAAKEAGYMFNSIKKELDITQDRNDDIMETMMRQIEALKEEITDLRSENENLSKEVDDLTLRIEHPGTWHGRKFGI